MDMARRNKNLIFTARCGIILKALLFTHFQTSLLNPSFLFTDSSEGQALALRFCIEKIDVNTYETTGTRNFTHKTHRH